jgi:hypothetical protein
MRRRVGGRERQMKTATGSFPVAALCAALVLLLPFALFAGCGSGEKPPGRTDGASEAAVVFLNALGERDVDTMRSLMSQNYLDANGVPDPITFELLLAALGYVNSYRFVPEEDIAIEGDRAVVSLDIDITGKGLREETLVLALEDGEWRVDAFTAMDWSLKPAAQDDERVQAEQALRDFLVACIDGDTTYIFDHLSPGYKESRRLEKPWTSAEFSGVFGTARSFDFDPGEINIDNGTAKVDVTVEFGSRGNLESETARAGLVKEGGAWLIDVFPFFIY